MSSILCDVYIITVNSINNLLWEGLCLALEDKNADCVQAREERKNSNLDTPSINYLGRFLKAGYTWALVLVMFDIYFFLQRLRD